MSPATFFACKNNDFALIFYKGQSLRVLRHLLGTTRAESLNSIFWLRWPQGGAGGPSDFGPHKILVHSHWFCKQKASSPNKRPNSKCMIYLTSDQRDNNHCILFFFKKKRKETSPADHIWLRLGGPYPLEQK